MFNLKKFRKEPSLTFADFDACFKYLAFKENNPTKRISLQRGYFPNNSSNKEIQKSSQNKISPPEIGYKNDGKISSNDNTDLKKQGDIVDIEDKDKDTAMERKLWLSKKHPFWSYVFLGQIK